MTIRSAQPKDIPALLGLLEQILSVHHQARPDIFKESGGKYSEEELKKLMTQSRHRFSFTKMRMARSWGISLSLLKKSLIILCFIPLKPSSSKTCVSIKQRVDKRSVINFINSLSAMPRKLAATT